MMSYDVIIGGRMNTHITLIEECLPHRAATNRPTDKLGHAEHLFRLVLVQVLVLLALSPGRIPPNFRHTEKQSVNDVHKLYRTCHTHFDLNVLYHSPISPSRLHLLTNLQSVGPILRTRKVQRVLCRVQACWEMDIRLGALRGAVDVGDGILASTIENPAIVGYGIL